MLLHEDFITFQTFCHNPLSLSNKKTLKYLIQKMKLNHSLKKSIMSRRQGGPSKLSIHREYYMSVLSDGLYPSS